jgi:hypothetical protein
VLEELVGQLPEGRGDEAQRRLLGLFLGHQAVEELLVLRELDLLPAGRGVVATALFAEPNGGFFRHGTLPGMPAPVHEPIVACIKSRWRPGNSGQTGVATPAVGLARRGPRRPLPRPASALKSPRNPRFCVFVARGRGLLFQGVEGRVRSDFPQPVLTVPGVRFLEPLREWTRSAVDQGLNGLPLNWYEGPGHYIGPHKDSRKGMVQGTPIVTV